LYVGSAKDLSKRLRDYFLPKYLKKELLKSNSMIYRALLKYNYNKFNIEILEYCEPSLLINREQYYINLLKPKYNILKIANSRLGIKHSPETLLKFKDRKHSPEALINLRKAMAGKIPSPLTKINQLLATGHVTIIINKKNNNIKKYPSIKSAARDINAAHSSLIYCMNNNVLLQNTFLIIRLLKIKY
jgi:group I intron endonuclease